ncbi:DUF5107 domain-containing protein [Paenibacillus nasutitermitis]|uniref:DUF5107 domain-containing protein n=1 Tax=Paenibacillus nasutitermitis TaxID=1652958 RepID=A0A917DP02_9BACL|nr:DUF5107 domain-containing protein [Paenibacillus nasutitermitis]GGD56174.1 hypothetical protein GCM10010911_12380 [Paenibacillus nasutitermitis]
MNKKISQATVREEFVEIPTYGVGNPDKNPMFLEKRVYQGSTGKVYPHPVIDKINDDKEMKTYRMIILENEYLRIEVMPEIGGRIYRAVDKTNNYDFVYYNRVIKPALVGLAGPWISGGIEFNWPQHHRPNTYGAVECTFSENVDGSATVWVSEIDRMYGTKMTAGFTLQAGAAYLEIHAQLYNRTPEPQTFLWWANPAVAVNDHTQSVFPPDVHAVFDHGKRDVSRFPVATGTYYKMDYSAGVDISRYTNIPVPTSYMAYRSDYNFVGGYDHSVQAGLLHVASHHISPGKKQWTWGNGEFGQAWDRNLTDEDGPYIELMTGVYTDNQPDFTWLQPYEEKSFTQYFMPYKGVGVVKNASRDAAVNLEVDRASGTIEIRAYTTSRFERASVELSSASSGYLQQEVDLSPLEAFTKSLKLQGDDQAHDLILSVRDKSGRLLVQYQEKEPAIEKMPDAAKPMPLPQELLTVEELFLAGLHLEQYRHATFEPEDYYLEGLKRSPGDIRINVAYGTLLLRRGLLTEAEACFRHAVQTLTGRNGNPYDSEAYYQLGLALKLQEKDSDAFDALYKSVWSAQWQDSGYFTLAQIACSRSDFQEALELVERSLIRNARNYKARDLKAVLLRKLGRPEEGARFALETISLDVADFGAYYERYLSLKDNGQPEAAQGVLYSFRTLMRGNAHNYLQLAADYIGSGLYAEAAAVLEDALPEHAADAYPMVHYTLGYVLGKLGRQDEAEERLKAGQAANSDYCFPNSLLDLQVLEYALRQNPDDARAHYYLGNLLYDKKRHQEAIGHWESSTRLDETFPTSHRNLALAYYNKHSDPGKARKYLELAYAADRSDARVLYELDQLYKKLGVSARERLDHLNTNRDQVDQRDDLFVEYVTLHNTIRKHEEALSLLHSRKFHPWEGGEGKVTGQYVLAHVELARQLLAGDAYKEAADMLGKALVYPVNLGEGKLAGAQENPVYYYLGCALEADGRQEEAKQAFRAASQGIGEPAGAMFYNDQPPETIYYQGLAWLKLGDGKEAASRFNKLIDYGETHLFDQVKLDYFAVSLPDFLVFDDDLNKRNEIHCRYMIGLGLSGLGRAEESQAQLDEVLRLEPNHQGAITHSLIHQSLDA